MLVQSFSFQIVKEFERIDVRVYIASHLGKYVNLAVIATSSVCYKV